MMMIHYNTQSMHTAGKAIQSNGQELQSDFQSFWSLYQTDTNGTFATFASCLTAFMNLCQKSSYMLAQNRSSIGAKLDQAATAAEQNEIQLRRTFRGHMIPE